MYSCNFVNLLKMIMTLWYVCGRGKGGGEGSHVAITHDAWDLIVQGPLHRRPAYPEIGAGDAYFKCTLWTFKQQLTLKRRVCCGISIVLLQISLYCSLRDMSSAHHSYLPSLMDIRPHSPGLPLSTMVLVYHVHILLEYVPVCIPSFLERYNCSS